jgi:hypothetical protein
MDVWLKVYNGTGAAVLNGAVFEVSFLDDTDGVYPKLLAPTENAAAVTLIGVVANHKLRGQTGIGSDEWGFVQIKGYCPEIKAVAAGMTDEHFLEVTAAVPATATSDGTSRTTKSFGIAKEAAAANALFGGWLFGDLVVIAAS